MKEANVSQIYRDGTYLAQHPDWHDEDGAWKARQVNTMLQRQRVSPQSICDVGCGTGRVLDELSKTLPAATTLDGYDFGSEAIATGTARGNPRVRLHCADALQVERSFDLILMIDVFEHVPDYLGFLTAFNQKARQFVFHIPLDLSVSSVARMSPLVAGRTSVGHLHYFSRETALATLADAGYRVTAEAYTPGGLELPARTMKRRAAKLPRRLGYAVNTHLTARFLGGFSLLVLAEGSGGGTARHASDS